MNRGNILYLGIALSYIVLAVIQWNAKAMLPIKIYYSIAVISNGLTILELIKTLLSNIKKNHNSLYKTTYDELNICDKHMVVFERLGVNIEEIQPYITYKSKLNDRIKRLKIQEKRIQYLAKFIELMSYFQILYACLTITTVSLKHIPDDLRTNKLIGALSLLSFAFIIFDSYIKHKYDTIYIDASSVINSTINTQNYYIDILEKVASREDNDGNH